MKLNSLLLIIATVLTILIGYSIYTYSVDTRKILSTVIFSFTFLIYVGMLLGVRMEYEKTQVLKNNGSVLFALYSLFICFIFIYTEYSIPIYLLINIGPLLIYSTIIIFFNKAKY